MSYHMCPIRQTLLGIQNLPTTCRVLLFVFFLSDKSTDKKRPLFRAWGRPCPQLSSHTPHTREKSPQQKKKHRRIYHEATKNQGRVQGNRNGSWSSFPRGFV